MVLIRARGRTPPSRRRLSTAVERLAVGGVGTVVTSALTAPEAEYYREAGFVDRERLCLLRRPLTKTGPEPDAPIGYGHRRDIGPALDVDGMAFEGFWRFDRRSFDDARRATPLHAFRVIRSETRPNQLSGYAISGLADARGYLQRLSVDPRVSGRGLGTALVLDAFCWLADRGARSVVVNTQETNRRALDLYQRLGFELQPDGLYVLERQLR